MHSPITAHSSKHKTRIALGVLFLVIALFGAGILAGAAMNSKVSRTDGTFNSELLSQVQGALNEKFVFWKASSTLPTDKDLEYGMIEGYVNAYKDPYTVFFPPAEAKSFQENVQGSFGGVGMNVGMKENLIVVIAPLKESPAEKAGILAGDIITAVDGTSTAGMSSDKAVNMIRGEIGTKVKLTVIHPNSKTTTDIVITRAEIKVPTIDTETINGAFVIHLYSFTAESPKLFQDALNIFIQSGSKYLVIDLRDNPGGYLDAAVQIASYFLPEGAVVVSEHSGKDEAVINHRSYGYTGVPKGVKIAVLVNGGSASASEILAGALKDHGVATILGEKSFGKGSVQELVNLSDGSSLKVTIAKWYTPNGINISASGIKPDTEVPSATTTPKLGKDNKPIDTQLQKAVTILEGGK